MKRQEIVITGIGVVAPNGIGRNEFLKALKEGVSGIDEIQSFHTSEYDVHRGGEVKGFEITRIPYDLPPYLGRTSQLAIAAVHEAMGDAGLRIDNIDPQRVGVIIGTTSGEVQAIEEVGEAWALGKEQELRPELYTGFASNIVSSNISAAFSLEGPTTMLANACASGNFAISLGCEMILQGEADLIIAGGVDSFSKVALAGFGRMRAVAPEMCQPFDRERKGMMVSEGCGVVILEEKTKAQQRGTKAYASILGRGLACDAFHVTAPDPEGMANAMRQAIADAGLALSEVGYVNAHGTGTPLNDARETDAIKMVFGGRAYRIPVSSIKSMIGHTMGAASAIETVACCLALQHDFLPPTINYHVPDPQCDLDYIPNSARFERVDVIMNNSFAFGGNSASLILGRE